MFLANYPACKGTRGLQGMSELKGWRGTRISARARLLGHFIRKKATLLETSKPLHRKTLLHWKWLSSLQSTSQENVTYDEKNDGQAVYLSYLTE